MNVAYPFKGVPVLNMDADSPWTSRWPAVAFFGDGVMGLSTGFEEDLDLIAHELAHGYWSIPLAWESDESVRSAWVPFNWIAEGAATFMQARAAGWLERADASPSDAIKYNISCTLGTIEEIDRKTFDGTLMEPCSYTMGLGIFAGLYNRLGDTEFRRGFGSLYLKMSSREHDDECVWESRGLCYMRKAFVEDASPGFAEAAGEVIDLWFHGK